MIDDKAPEAISEFSNADTDLGVALQAFRKGIERDFQVCFPACVYSYDRYTHTAEVMPLLKAGYFTGEIYEFIRRKPITVSVRQICCGGISLDFPLFVGDTGWVISSDRDTSLLRQLDALTSSALSHDRLIKVLENEYQQIPKQPLIHDFTQGFFIPDNWSRWEYYRYKDAPQVPISSSIYIGSSFDSYEGKSEDSAVKYQKGNAYENKKTSSLVLNPEGNAVLACSKSEDSGDKSMLELSGDAGEIVVNNAKTGDKVRLSISEKDGILLRTSTFRGDVKDDGTVTPKELFKDALFKVNRDEIVCRISQGMYSSVSLTLKGGDLTLGFTGNMNILCDGDAKIQAGGNSVVNVGHSANVNIGMDANVNVGFGAHFNCGGDTTINTGGKATVTAGGDASINAGGDVNLAAVEHVCIAGGTRVELESAGDIDLTTRAEGSINIETTQGGQMNLKTRDYESDITISSDKSNIDIRAEGKIDLTSATSISIGAPEVNISGGNYLNLMSARYNLSTSRWMWNQVRIVKDMEDGLAVEGGGYLGNEDDEAARKKYLENLEKIRKQNRLDDLQLEKDIAEQKKRWEEDKAEVEKKLKEAAEERAKYEKEILQRL